MKIRSVNNIDDSSILLSRRYKKNILIKF